jgi:hypothetical protein
VDQELKVFLKEMEARLGERFAHMDERFARMDERFARIDERFDHIDERFEELETEVRQTRVLVEAVDSNVRLVAEGVMGVTERLEAFQEEAVLGFKDVKASIVPYYQNLDSRVRILEAKADRQTEDVLESIRKKFGKPQS